MNITDSVSAGSEQSSLTDNSFKDRRERMLARLNARHSHTNKVCETEALNSNFDSLIARAQRMLLDNGTNSERLEILTEIDNAIALVPTGLQARRLKEMQKELRTKFQSNIEQRTGASSFAFKSKIPEKLEKRTAGEKHHDVVSDVEKASILQGLKRSENTVDFVDKRDEEVRLNGYAGNDVLLRNLENCNIIIGFNASAVHISNVKSSKLVFPPVQSSILIRNCEDTVVAAAAQQIRLHDCHHVKLFVSVQGAVIIEDCDDISVAPYHTRGEEARGNLSNDNWKNVKDFNWLHPEIHSPHWRIMESCDWETFDV